MPRLFVVLVLFVLDLLDLFPEPVHPLLEALARDGATRGDVPAPPAEIRQLQVFPNLGMGCSCRYVLEISSFSSKFYMNQQFSRCSAVDRCKCAMMSKHTHQLLPYKFIYGPIFATGARKYNDQ